MCLCLLGCFYFAICLMVSLISSASFIVCQHSFISVCFAVIFTVIYASLMLLKHHLLIGTFNL